MWMIIKDILFTDIRCHFGRHDWKKKSNPAKCNRCKCQTHNQERIDSLK